MMVESASMGSERPKILMAPLSEKGRPIWPRPQASGEQRHVVVVAGQQRGAGKGQRGGAMAVDDGVNLLGGGGVGDGDHVVADLRDADGAALGRDVVDGVAGVGFARGGVGSRASR